MNDLMFVFGGTMILIAPIIGAMWFCEKNQKCRRFIEWVGKKYF